MNRTWVPRRARISNPSYNLLSLIFTPTPGIEPGSPEGPGLAIRCNTIMRCRHFCESKLFGNTIMRYGHGYFERFEILKVVVLR